MPREKCILRQIKGRDRYTPPCKRPVYYVLYAVVASTMIVRMNILVMYFDSAYARRGYFSTKVFVISLGRTQGNSKVKLRAESGDLVQLKVMLGSKHARCQDL